MEDSAQTEGVAVIIGVGPQAGLGGTLCRRFADVGYHVIAAGRTQENLDAIAAAINAGGGAATGLTCDTTDPASVAALFEQSSAFGPVKVAIYNAGNNMPGDFLTMEPEYFETCWRVGCFGGFLFGQQALQAMLPQSEGTLIFTGASASLRGKPFFSAFAAAKAGLRMVAQSLAREFGPQGIHVAHVVIDGAIDGDRINKGWPDIAESLGKDRMVDLEGLADVFVMLESQPPRAWTLEMDVRTAAETF